MATPKELQGLFLAMLGRIADPSGFDFWNTPPRSNQTFSQVASAFAASSEYKQKVLGFTIEQRIDQAYRQLLGRERDVLETFWVNEVKGNRVAIDQVPFLIIQGVSAQPPTSTDRVAMDARLEAAARLTDALRFDQSASVKYTGDVAGAFTAEVLNPVRGSESIPTAAQAQQMVGFLGRKDPLLGSINLSLDPTKPKVEQFQTEISTTVTIGLKVYGYSSGGGDTLQVTDLTNPAAPTFVYRVPLAGYTSLSVASFGPLIAVALSPVDYSTNGGRGVVRFYRVEQNGSLRFLRDEPVGFLPDSVAFSEDGKKLLIANEGEPTNGYGIDRPGTIGIIAINESFGRVDFQYTDLGFGDVPLPPGVRVSGPLGTTKANDIEPEYATIFGDYGYVTLEENNGVAKVNLQTKQIEKVFASGAVDFFTQLVDLSDKDGPGGTPVFAPKLGQPFEGLRQADGIAAYQAKGQTWFMTANEGDTRDYGTYIDEVRGIGPDRVKRLLDDNNVGSADRITIFGGRSVSIFNAQTGQLAWDSGNTLQTVAAAAGVYDDTRSDDKGVEPEGIVIFELLDKTYAVVSLERTTKSMLVVFDVTNPNAASFVTSLVINNSIAPEGLYVVEAAQSPTGRQMLAVSNEVSNTLDLVDLALLVKAAPAAGAGTFQPTMIKDVAGGPVLTINNLLTVGEFAPGLAAGASVYAPPGIPDGTGAFDNGDGTFTLFVNHELGATVGYANQVLYAPNEVDPKVAINIPGARISKFIVDKDVDDDSTNGYQSKIISSGLAYTTVIGSDKDGFDRFCGASFYEAAQFGGGRGFQNALYITGEESNGSLYVLDPSTSILREAPSLGKGSWENVALVDTGNVNTVGLVLFDDSRAPLYFWLGNKIGSGDLLDRNGLSNGRLYAWKPADGVIPEAGTDSTPGPDSDDLKAIPTGTPLPGGWVFLGDQNFVIGKTAAQLRAAAVSAGAMQFSRPEDGDTNPSNGKQVVFNTTGNADFASGDKYGNVLTLDFTNAFNPNGQLNGVGTTVMKVIYDGDKLPDPTTGLRSPDNILWGADGFIYDQEDRTATPWGTQDSSIWKLNPSKVDPLTGQASAERWAVIQRQTPYGQTDSFPGEAGLGEWETSGIIALDKIYNALPGTYFLSVVQAHGNKDGNIWGSNYLGEGGSIVTLQQQLTPLLG